MDFLRRRVQRRADFWRDRAARTEERAWSFKIDQYQGVRFLLILYAWPRNIRQLANEVRRLTALTESGAFITPDHLSPQLHAERTHSSIHAVQAVPQVQVRIDQPLEKATAPLESEMIKHALSQAGGRVSAAASTLGISRKGLYLKRLRLGLVDFNDRAS